MVIDAAPTSFTVAFKIYVKLILITTTTRPGDLVVPDQYG